MTPLLQRALFFGAGLVFGVAVGLLLGSSPSETPRPPPVPDPLPPAAAEVDAARLEERMTAVRDAPDDPAARARVAELYLEVRNFQDAVYWFQQAHNLAPGDPDIRSRLAFARIGVGDVEAAKAEFEAILAEDPDHADSLLAMGRLKLYLDQDIDAGIRYWERLVEAAPGSAAATAVREELEALRRAHP